MASGPTPHSQPYSTGTDKRRLANLAIFQNLFHLSDPHWWNVGNIICTRIWTTVNSFPFLIIRSDLDKGWGRDFLGWTSSSNQNEVPRDSTSVDSEF